MPENELPKNMGKKIADALKKQNEGIEEVTEVIEEYNTAENVGGDYNANETSNDFNTDSSFEMNYEDNNMSDYSAPVFNVDSDDINENPELKLTIDSEDDT